MSIRTNSNVKTTHKVFFKKPKNKTKKNPLPKDANLTVYNKFKGTKLIPTTNIIQYIKSNYNDFVTVKKDADEKGKNSLYMDDCFNFENKLNNGTDKKFSINTSVESNPKMSLNKLIAYSFYLKMKYIFVTQTGEVTTMDDFLDKIKYQIGKDVKRDNRTINNTPYNAEYFANQESDEKDINYYSIADTFYQLVIDYYAKNNLTVNYNAVNIIALFSCQNLYNLLTDLVIIKLNDMLKPEMSNIMHTKKKCIINITPTVQTVELVFESDVVISQHGGTYDLEYPCGKLNFTFLVDLITNTYKFSHFAISYDLDKCGPEENNAEENNAAENNGVVDKYRKTKIAAAISIPLAVSVVGIATMPYILGALGGKNTKNTKNAKKKEKNKTKKNKKEKRIKIKLKKQKKIKRKI
jgi:hypothetical protein